MVKAHPMFAPLAFWVKIQRTAPNRCPHDGWAVVTNAGVIYAHPTRLGSPEEWAYVLAHCLLHLGFGHFDARALSREWNDACDWFLLGFLRHIQIGRPPSDMVISAEAPAATEESIYDAFRLQGLPADWRGCGATGRACRAPLGRTSQSRRERRGSRESLVAPQWRRRRWESRDTRARSAGAAGSAHSPAHNRQSQAA